MWRLSVVRKTTRAGGYAFWRESTLQQLESTKRPYLLQERPFPIAEVVKRMIKIRRSYDSASDNHERTLLRGEYKFFTGKICDLRGAHPDDMISYLESAYFFGFWDAEQVAKILERKSNRGFVKTICLLGT